MSQPCEKLDQVSYYYLGLYFYLCTFQLTYNAILGVLAEDRDQVGRLYSIIYSEARPKSGSLNSSDSEFSIRIRKHTGTQPGIVSCRRNCYCYQQRQEQKTMGLIRVTKIRRISFQVVRKCAHGGYAPGQRLRLSAQSGSGIQIFYGQAASFQETYQKL